MNYVKNNVNSVCCQAAKSVSKWSVLIPTAKTVHILSAHILMAASSISNVQGTAKPSKLSMSASISSLIQSTRFQQRLGAPNLSSKIYVQPQKNILAKRTRIP